MSGIPPRILLLEDDSGHARLVQRAFQRHALGYQLTHVGSLAAAREHLANVPCDLVLSDLLLPDGRGTELLGTEADGQPIPIVILTSHGDEQVAVEAMKAGALDYVVKSEVTLNDLPRIAQRTLTQWRLMRERENAVAAMCKSEATLAKAQRIAHIGGWQLDLVTGALEGSHELYRILGMAAEQFDGDLTQFIQDFVHPDDQQGLQESARAAIDSGTVGTTEFRIRRPDGTQRTVTAEAELELDRLGQPARIVGTLQDITERRTAEAALQESEVRFHQLAESIDQVFWFHNLNPKYCLYVSPAFEVIWNRPVEDLYNDAAVWAQSIHAEDQDRVNNLFESWLCDERPDYESEYRIVRPDGTVRWILETGTKIRDSRGDIYRVSGIARDITERRRTEEALRESESRFRQMASHIHEVFWLIDWHRREILYVSPAYETIWGRSCQSAYDDPTGWADVIAHEDCQRVAQAYVRQATSGQYDEQYRIVQPDGQVRWVRDRTFPIRNGDQEVYRIARVTEDITLQIEAAEQDRRHHDELVHMARLSTMGEMVAGIAHEINQPLYAIINYSAACSNTLARNNEIEFEKIRKWTGQIAQQADRAGKIINRLGKFMRKAAPHCSKTDLNELVREAIDFVGLQARSSKVTVKLDLAEPSPSVLVDGIQIQQVLVNLLQNAFDALTGVDDTQRIVVVRSAVGDETVQVSVEDNGPGFAVEPGRVFDTFFTTKPDGVGMGLAISRSIIDTHEGRLWAESRSPRGAAFHFTLSRVRQGVAHVS